MRKGDKGKKVLALILIVILMFLGSIFSGVVAATTYDPQAAVNYADTWWNGRNPNYHDYSSGGDCANFVSQCLIAGGLDLSGHPGADSWGCIPSCTNLQDYLVNYLGATYETRPKSQAEPIWFVPGDPAIFPTPKHAVFAVTGDATHYATCNAHSTDRYHMTIQWFFDNSNWISCTYYHIPTNPADVTLTLYVHEGSPSGPLLSGVRVTGQDAAGTGFDKTTGTGGYVTITGAPGSWQFSASKSGYQTDSWTQSITETCTRDAFLEGYSPITAAIDQQLLDLIDQYASSYYNSAWDLNINQYKAWVATIARAEGGKGGYVAHSQGAPGSDVFDHRVAGSDFKFSTGIGPFQLDRGSTENWGVWPTIDKLDPGKAVVSAMRLHSTFPAGASLEYFAENSPWYAVNPNHGGDPAGHWNAVTGTNWNSHKNGETELDWSNIKDQLAQNADKPDFLYENNVRSSGTVKWNIKESEGIQTDTEKKVIFDGYYQTWLITARGWGGTEVCEYYYTYRSDENIEIWVWDNSNDPVNKFKYIFVREYSTGPYPEGYNKPSWGVAGETLQNPALFLISPPTLISPPNNSHQTSSITFYWSSVSGATNYELSVKFPGSSSWLSDQTASTSYPYSPTLIGEYHWRVRAYVSGSWSDYSDEWIFYFDGAPAPTLISPPNNAEITVLRPTFQWNSVPGSISYQLQLARDSSFTDMVRYNLGIASTSWQLDTDLTAGQTYYWRVRSGIPIGFWSTVWHFTVVEPTYPPTVTTNAATLVEETTATLNGVISSDGCEACQYRFEYDTNSGEPYAYNTGWTGSKTTGQSFNAAISSLNKGTKYYFRAQAKNSAGTGSGSELTFLTKPDAPTSFSATTASTTQIDLSWTKGAGAQKTRIQRKQGSYPANRNDGTQVYFDTGSSTADTGLTPGTTYYYRAWSYVQGSEQWSDNHAQDWATTTSMGAPTVTTNAATNVEETTATLNGVINNDGGEACQYRFEYDTNPGEPYTHNTGWTGSKTTGQSFNAAISSLSKGTKYYFRAQAKNSAGTASGSELTFLTKPDALTSFSATTAGTTQIDLSWTKGAGAQKTKIQRKQGSYPANRNDGTQVYFGTGSSTPDTGLTPGTTYYYRTWSYVQGSEQWSDNHAQDWATTTSIGAPTVTTKAASGVGTTSATLNGNLDDTGGESCQVWFEYGKTTSYGSSSSPESKSSTGSFSKGISGLDDDTTYHFRAVASNSKGTVYGLDNTFKTEKEINPPQVTTNSATSIATTSATLNGNLDDTGGESCQVWFEYGKATSYGYATPKQSKSSTGLFSKGLSGLDDDTTYHFRAVASNSKGTVYGLDNTFKTKKETYPELSYSPTSHDFGNKCEGVTDSTTFDVWNSGTGTLTYSLSESCGWIDVQPTSGSSTGEHDTITVDIDTTSLFEGYHTCDISLSSNGGSGTFTVMVNVVQYPESSWTFMIYLDGDNNLESAAIDDFLEMSSVGSTSDVNIVVQFDRIPGYDSSYGDWTDCKRFHVTAGMTPTPANAISDLGECNMGDPNTLRDFVEWTMTNFPADNYALILWNHGDGWKSINNWVPWAADIKDAKDAGLTRGICWDNTNNDYLSLQETEQALTGKYVQLLGYDACLMHMIEVVYQVMANAGVSVGSEEVESWDGWPYDTILADLTVTPTMNEDALGTVIVDRYMASYPTPNDLTQSAMDNSALPNLVAVVDNLAQALMTEINGGHWTQVQQARNAAEEIYYTYYIDLYHFAEKIPLYVPGAAAQAQAVMNEVSKMYEAHGTSVPNDHGLSIYYPRVEGDYLRSYDNTAFAIDTQWDEFLERYYEGPVLVCEGTDTSCGIYPDCENCDEKDGCYAYGNGCEERDYYCVSNEAGCDYTHSNRHTDGWVDTGNTDWVEVNECQEKEQKEQEYRDYYCSGGACTYSVTGTKWVDTGNTKNKPDGTICGCTASNTLKRCDGGVCTDTGICDSTICDADATCDGKRPGDSCGGGRKCDSTCKCGAQAVGEDYGVFSGGLWFVDTTGDHAADDVFGYGFAGATPLVGDIDQDGTDDIAVIGTYGGNYRWFVDTTGDHVADEEFWFGFEGAIPLVGDFDQDGTDDIAIVKAYGGNYMWFVDTNGDKTADKVFWFGPEGATPLVGDFDQDGTDDIAVIIVYGGNYRWFVDTNGDHVADEEFWFGFEGAIPLVGDFDRDGTDDIAIVKAYGGNYMWFVDTNFDKTADQVFWFGFEGSIPLAGDIG